MATASYVGDWRPHRPRGPIGAHFKSPGPKYMLPGSTGFRIHDARKYRNPAFSFGTRHATFTNDCSPGPGYLVPANITNKGTDGTPKYSLYGRHKGIAPFKNPGPGTYSPEKSGRSAQYSAPSYSLSGRTKGHKSDISPGPAAYMLPKVLGPESVGRLSLPSYTMVSRRSYGSFHDDLQRTPGPGTYRVIAPWVYKNRGPLYSMTGRNMLPSDATRKPGPGAHSPEKVYVTRRHAPKYSFGIPHSEYIAPLIVDPGH
uniref:outer dense fiber protein 3-like isoform X1 n=1 Tax=Ciona intestinalis TaxID=7719 RepID=UPI00006A47C9|nr:outer dense fiber protein 3-like isoform X1 [Ciona intestinalis]XP_026696260.1 outer dense fiber protein 3-like isoform X1 [Ciona intestinalis]|eukprot:XP_009857704.1 outer dense fiber protein 3-like isoform X1 [Ciona intestinalis]